MEFHQLRYFVAVAEERHFTKAARGLHVAQPSVSRAIRVLEEELGTSLFHRMKGNVALTPAGETLLPWARRVLADVDGATGEVRELADLRRGRLAVGATPSLTITLLPPALAKFHSAYPGIDLVLQEAGSRDLVRELEQGVLGLAAAGLGVAVVPSLVIDPAGPLKAVRLAEPLTRTIGFANRKDRHLSRAGREFVQTVRALTRARDWLRARPPGLTVLDAKS